MGLDGGTIATRTDLLRRSSWRLANADGGNQRSTRGGQLTAVGATSAAGVEQRDRRAEARDGVSTCALSGVPLPAAPAPGEVVACCLGNLYHRNAVVEYLTKHGQFAPDMCDTATLDATFGHIARLRDVFGVTLSPNPQRAAVVAESEGGSGDSLVGAYVCPVDQHVSTNGQHAFVALRPCGHVVREKVAQACGARLSNPHPAPGPSGAGAAASSSGCSSVDPAPAPAPAATRAPASDGITTIQGGAWGCPICSAAVEVSVRLMPPADVCEVARAALAVEREARQERKKRKRAAE